MSAVARESERVHTAGSYESGLGADAPFAGTNGPCSVLACVLPA